MSALGLAGLGIGLIAGGCIGVAAGFVAVLAWRSLQARP
jgi:hypothetical protein